MLSSDDDASQTEAVVVVRSGTTLKEDSGCRGDGSNADTRDQEFNALSSAAGGQKTNGGLAEGPQAEDECHRHRQLVDDPDCNWRVGEDPRSQNRRSRETCDTDHARGVR